MRRTTLIILICCIFSILLTACHDANETDDFAHVLAVGIDKGISNKWRITVQFATLKSDGGSKIQTTGGNQDFETQEQDGYTFITLDAPSFYGGVSMINSILSRIAKSHARGGERMLSIEEYIAGTTSRCISAAVSRI
jgi:spore germination protein KC